MKKIYIYAGIGGWLALITIIILMSVSIPDDQKIEKKFQMNQIVTHPISEDHSIAVKVTNATIVLDSQTCIFEICDDRDPGKYVLTVMMNITNLGDDDFFDSPHQFEIEDSNGQRYILTDRESDLVHVSKGESFTSKISYDVDIPILQYSLILKQHWSDKETLIVLDHLQKLRPSLCQGMADCFGGFIKNIIDGDTLDILDIESGQVKRIRLSLVDTPEINEENFDNARDFTSGFCPVDSYVLFDQDDGQIDGSFGRMIGKLFCNGNQLNDKLLEHNLAHIDTRFCGVSEYGNETWAKTFGC